MDIKKLKIMVSDFMDDSVPYSHNISPHVEDKLKEVVGLVAWISEELSDEELGYLVRNSILEIVNH